MRALVNVDSSLRTQVCTALCPLLPLPRCRCTAALSERTREVEAAAKAVAAYEAEVQAVNAQREVDLRDAMEELTQLNGQVRTDVWVCMCFVCGVKGVRAMMRVAITGSGRGLYVA